ncbi:MAG: hypothetical protein QM757_26395 [Paludibaculum sp.]
MPSTQQVLDQDRNYIIQQQQMLQDRSTDRAWNAQQRRIQAQAQADEQFDPLIGGNGGYRDDERAGILQEDMIKGGMTTDAELQGNYLSNDEGAAIQGNPNAASDYFDPSGFDNTLASGAAARGEAAAGLEKGYADAIDPTKMAYAKQNLSDPRAVLDRTKLTQDSNVADQSRLTPQQQQEMVTGAGISAGAGYRASIDRMQRDARAAGVDPVGAAALSADFERKSAADAGDAMTQARIAANAEAAKRNMSLEDQRLAAEQGYAGLATSATNAANTQAIQQEAQRAGSEQTIAGQKAAAGSPDVGHLKDTQAADQMKTGLATKQYLQDTAMKTATDADAKSSARATTLATNRQATAQANQATKFNQGYNVSGALSDRNQTVADARKQDQYTGLNYLQHKADEENSNEQAEYDRQSGLYTGRGTMQQANTGQQMQWNSRPSTWQKVVGAVTSGVGAAMSGGFADGGVVNKPTLAMVGENGPEAIVPLDGGVNAKTRPSMIAGGGYDRVVNPPTPGGMPQPGAAPNYLETGMQPQGGGALPMGSAPQPQPITASYMAPKGAMSIPGGQPKRPSGPRGGYGPSAWQDRAGAGKKRPAAAVGGYQQMVA